MFTWLISYSIRTNICFNKLFQQAVSNIEIMHEICKMKMCAYISIYKISTGKVSKILCDSTPSFVYAHTSGFLFAATRCFCTHAYIPLVI